MSVKMRLTRHGRKGFAYYHIVVADSRAPRDGRFIERIGSYNPNTNPATIDLEFDKAYNWLEKGAQPTDTVRAILSYKGVMYKKHLMGGVKKGVFGIEEAEARLQAWMTEKEARIQAKRDRLGNESDKLREKMLHAESKKKEAKAEIIAAKNARLAIKAQEESKVTPEESAPEEQKPPVSEALPENETIPEDKAPAEEQ